MRKTNDAGVELIKSFEALRLKAYYDSVGVITIGYGHTGRDVHPNDVITEERADALLRADLATAEAGVEKAIGPDATDNEFAACVSLAFNIGTGAFAKSSIVRLMAAGETDQAADKFLAYNKAGGKVLAGLTRRRKAERELFLTADEPAAPPPAPVVAVASSTTTTTTPAGTTTTEQQESFISGLGVPEAAKEIAKSGVTRVGTSAATALGTAGAGAGLKAFIDGHLVELIFAAFLILLAVGVVIIVIVLKHKTKQKVIDVNADKTKNDVKLL